MFLQALHQIKAHLGRSLLTALGVIISITAVTTISSVMQSLELSVNLQLKSLGSEMVSVQSAYSGVQLGRREWDALSSQVSGIQTLVASQQISSRYSVNTNDLAIRFGGVRKNLDVIAATSTLPELYKNTPIDGRFIMASDEAAHHRVCVITEDVISLLGLPPNPIGMKLSISNFSLEIVGVMPKFRKGNGRQLGQVYIPFAIADELQNGTRPWQFSFLVKDVEHRQFVLNSVRQTLRASLQLPPNYQENFTIQDAGQLLAANNEIIQLISIVLILLVSISLFIGAIGIMNVMLVSVTQRTREIGVLRALGATKWHIRLQFLIEAGSISIMGALIGVVVGMLLAHLIVGLALERVESTVIPIWAMLSSIGISLLVGVVAGSWPAERAAQLDPINALASE